MSPIAWAKNWIAEWKPSAVTLGAPIFPLGVLFGLNAVDELDRAAFALLLPEIRDHFTLTNEQALAMVSVTTIAVLLVEVPLSFYADRRNRVRIATTGAALWALFSVGTGAALTIPMLMLMRLGAGTGRAVVTPTHTSLIADFYQPAARVKAYSVHRQANSVGQILGPGIAGLVAGWFSWRTPFFVLAVPTAICVVLAMRLREPARGALDGRLEAPADPVGPIETMRTLYRVRTIRRIWCAVPFLGITLFGVPNLLSLIYRDVFDLSTAQRGLIAAGVEPLQVIGVFAAIPWVSRKAMSDPGFLMRFVALVGVFDGALLAALAYAPNPAVAVAIHALVAGSIGTLAPAFVAMVSLVAPAHVRSASFSTISLFAIPGIGLFLPLIGRISDSVGVQESMLVMVPVTLMAGFVLSSGARFVGPDIGAAFATPLPVADESITDEPLDAEPVATEPAPAPLVEVPATVPEMLAAEEELKAPDPPTSEG